MKQFSIALSIYEEALEKLKDPKFDSMNVFLHDYKEKCYKQDPAYTLNGLHWGYPDAIVMSVTGKSPARSLAFEYGAFDEPTMVNRRRYAENSRHSLVPYVDVRAVIEKGIRQKYEECKKNAAPELKAIADWESQMQKTPYKNAAVRIDIENKEFKITAIKPNRLVVHGFGTFLENAIQGEISVSPQAMKALERIPQRSGLMGLEIALGGNMLVCYSSTAFSLQGIPAEAVSVDKNGWDEIKKLITVE